MKIKKILLILLLFISGCSFGRGRDISIEDYNYYLDINNQLSFSGIQGINRTQNLTINNKKYDTKSSLDVLERGYNDYVYHLYVSDGEDYDSYYIDNVNYIKSNNEKYSKKVLLNAYTRMIGKYLHTDFINISYTGIKEVAITDTSLSIVLNDAGILEYFNDIYVRNDMYIEEPDFINGSVSISYVFGNYILKQVNVEGEIEYKNGKANINESITLGESKGFDVITDLESYGTIE